MSPSRRLLCHPTLPLSLLPPTGLLLHGLHHALSLLLEIPCQLCHGTLVRRLLRPDSFLNALALIGNATANGEGRRERQMR
ncbi:hypothetical protein E2562_001849 [Oryza meyeriana var. granulata]|uniref:Uncharacterized protein n=1 Tax=Oryza meyeriana var. granulata TaxID=110450 RepID=A0A6G1C334_9ORYZ|nr:hypothetical protein E2562_001849 [Oryza meyeriana var. granulata]